jgi:hypothetical protein
MTSGAELINAVESLSAARRANSIIGAYTVRVEPDRRPSSADAIFGTDSQAIVSWPASKPAAIS